MYRYAAIISGVYIFIKSCNKVRKDKTKLVRNME